MADRWLHLNMWLAITQFTVWVTRLFRYSQSGVVCFLLVTVQVDKGFLVEMHLPVLFKLCGL